MSNEKADEHDVRRSNNTQSGQRCSCILKACGIEKRFGPVVALSGLDLEIRESEIVAIVGDNGAGKSTFVNTLAGMLRPTGGWIEFCGRRVELNSPEAARRLGIETVYQDLGLCENLSVAENVFLGREVVRGWGPFRRVDSAAMRREAADVLKTLAVNVPSADAKVSSLSGGQRQAVALARCRLWRRRIAILDEPTAALGVQESASVVRAIKQLNRDGVAIVLVSHDIPMVLELVDRIAVLRKGTKVADFSSDGATVDMVVGLIAGSAERGSEEDER